MKKKYWLDRWEQKDIGFHQNETNPYLRKYWQGLKLAQHSEVLVPLCGKSLGCGLAMPHNRAGVNPALVTASPRGAARKL